MMAKGWWVGEERVLRECYFLRIQMLSRINEWHL